MYRTAFSVRHKRREKSVMQELVAASSMPPAFCKQYELCCIFSTSAGGILAELWCVHCMGLWHPYVMMETTRKVGEAVEQTGTDLYRSQWIYHQSCPESVPNNWARSVSKTSTKWILCNTLTEGFISQLHEWMQLEWTPQNYYCWFISLFCMLTNHVLG